MFKYNKNCGGLKIMKIVISTTKKLVSNFYKTLRKKIPIKNNI